MQFEQIWIRYVLYVLVAGLFGVTVLATRSRGEWRKVLGLIGLILGITSIPFVWIQNFPIIWSIFLTLIILSAIVDAGRMYVAKFNDQNKAHKTLVDVGVLAGAFLIVTILALVVGGRIANYAIVFISLAAGIYGISRMIFAYTHFRFPHEKRDTKLPSLTLAIPARNETHSLAECLMAASASDYEKLEIMVLDDCSQDHTSQVIRSFAHDGVQFIQGDLPASGWLGKNYAMRRLAKQANGEFIAFMNVDVRLSKESLTKIMTLMTSRELDMVSILPRRDYAWHFSGIMGTLRYFWQVVLPPTKFRTPVASSIWIIRRDKLEEMGGFAGQRHKILPENYFARQLAPDKKYKFFIGDKDLGINDAKHWRSLAKTSIRLLYPTWHRRSIEAFSSIAAHMIMLAPYVFVTLSIIEQNFNVMFYLSLATVILYSITATLYAILIRRSWIFAFLTFPFQLAQEIMLILISVAAYEFGEVDWKGRNVCYPVMEPKKRH